MQANTSSKQHHESPIKSSNNFNRIISFKKFQLYQIQYKKKLDCHYLLTILNDSLNLSGLTANLNRNNYTLHHGINKCQKTNKSVSYQSCLMGAFIETLFNVYVDDFENASKIVGLLCAYKRQINELIYSSQQRMISPCLIKKLITYLVMCPNFLSSSNQTEKVNFVKKLIVQLIVNDLFDPNDCSNLMKNTAQSNNILNHLLKLLHQVKTLYQLELLFDLMRMFIQYGANPNIDPFDQTTFSSGNFMIFNFYCISSS